MFIRSLVAILLTSMIAVSGTNANGETLMELTRQEMDNLVRRSYQYVALYNVNNKFAMDQENPTNTGGWNKVVANTTLLDHTIKAIARPNNDTLYVTAMLDVRDEPVILESPAFDSKYVSLMVTGYDHYVNVPLTTRLGDFAKPTRIMFYTKRTRDYAGETIDGVDKIVEMTGDFLSAVYRVMPHMSDPERLKRNLDAMRQVKVMTLSQYKSGSAVAAPVSAVTFPAFGKTNFDTFENNLLEVMQFVFNHTTFDPANELDQAILAAYAPLGVAPGQQYDAGNVAGIDGAKVRAVAEEVFATEMANAADPRFMASNATKLFQPKGKMTLERLVVQSVLGPIGLPASEAMYPPVATADGKPMNAMHDYVIRMTKDEMPPAKAFWSITLYDTANGFFIPNDSKKYSVGENAGYRMSSDGGIEIHIAEKQPQGVPAENWLPINRGDYSIDAIMRIYVPDLDRFATWKAPLAERTD